VALTCYCVSELRDLGARHPSPSSENHQIVPHHLTLNSLVNEQVPKSTQQLVLELEADWSGGVDFHASNFRGPRLCFIMGDLGLYRSNEILPSTVMCDHQHALCIRNSYCTSVVYLGLSLIMLVCLKFAAPVVPGNRKCHVANQPRRTLFSDSFAP
jgi:hypothetical protein